MLTLLKQIAQNSSLSNEISYNALNQTNFDTCPAADINFPKEQPTVKPVQEKPVGFIVGEMLKVGYDKLSLYFKNAYNVLRCIYQGKVSPDARSINNELVVSKYMYKMNPVVFFQRIKYGLKNSKLEQIELYLSNVQNQIEINSQAIDDIFLLAVRNDNRKILRLLHNKVKNISEMKLEIFEEGLKLALEHNDKLGGVREILGYQKLYDQFKEGPRDGYVISDRIFRFMSYFFKRLEKDRNISKENKVISSEYEVLTPNGIGSMLAASNIFDAKIRMYLDVVSSMWIGNNYQQSTIYLDKFSLALSNYGKKFNNDIIDVTLYAVSGEAFAESSRMYTTFELLLDKSMYFESDINHIEEIYEHAKKFDNRAAQYLILKKYCLSPNVPGKHYAHCDRDNDKRLNCDHKAARSCFLFLKTKREETNARNNRNEQTREQIYQNLRRTSNSNSHTSNLFRKRPDFRIR